MQRTIRHAYRPVTMTPEQSAAQYVRTSWARSFLHHAENARILKDLTHMEISRAVQLRDAGETPERAAEVISIERWN